MSELIQNPHVLRTSAIILHTEAAVLSHFAFTQGMKEATLIPSIILEKHGEIAMNIFSFTLLFSLLAVFAGYNKLVEKKFYRSNAQLPFLIVTNILCMYDVLSNILTLALHQVK